MYQQLASVAHYRPVTNLFNINALFKIQLLQLINYFIWFLQ